MAQRHGVVGAGSPLWVVAWGAVVALGGSAGGGGVDLCAESRSYAGEHLRRRDDWGGGGAEGGVDGAVCGGTAPDVRRTGGDGCGYAAGAGVVGGAGCVSGDGGVAGDAVAGRGNAAAERVAGVCGVLRAGAMAAGAWGVLTTVFGDPGKANAATRRLRPLTRAQR